MSYYIELNAQQAEALISEQKPMILDVRDFVSYKEQHIDGAMHSHGDLVEHLIARQQFERPVLVYCYHGNSSKDLATVLGRAGFDAYSLKGGFTAWKKRHSSYADKPYQEATNVWLEDHGFDKQSLNAVNHQMEVALIVAAREGNAAVVAELIAAGADLEISNGDGNTALWAACYKESEEVMQQLIKAGADINHQNPDGVSVLMYAASAGKTEVVKTLVEAGADTALKSRDEFTALDLAANSTILRYLKQQEATA